MERCRVCGKSYDGGFMDLISICPDCRRQQQFFEQQRERDEAIARKQEAIEREREEQEAYYASLPECIYCGQKFEKHGKYFDYCSKRCMIDDLGRERIQDYLQKKQRQEEKRLRREKQKAEQQRIAAAEKEMEYYCKQIKIVWYAIQVLNPNDFSSCALHDNILETFNNLLNILKAIEGKSFNDVATKQRKQIDRGINLLHSLKEEASKDFDFWGYGKFIGISCFGFLIVPAIGAAIGGGWGIAIGLILMLLLCIIMLLVAGYNRNKAALLSECINKIINNGEKIYDQMNNSNASCTEESSESKSLEETEDVEEEES